MNRALADPSGKIAVGIVRERRNSSRKSVGVSMGRIDLALLRFARDRKENRPERPTKREILERTEKHVQRFVVCHNRATGFSVAILNANSTDR